MGSVNDTLDDLVYGIIFDDVAHQDLLPAYREMHELGPVWSSRYGMTVTVEYASGLEVLRNPRWGRAEADMPRRTFGGTSVSSGSSTMLLLNPPDHTRIRSLVSRAFTPRRVEELRPRLEKLVEPMIDALAEGGGGDVMTHLAVPFPVAVISELLGVPQEETMRFTGLVRDTTSLIDAAADDEARARGMAAGGELAAYFVELAGEKRAHPDDGLFTALINVEAEGDRLSEEELILNTILLYAAGFETTSNLIGNGLYALLRNPGQLQRLRDEPALMESAIWEMLRFDSPVQLNGRNALVDDEFRGEPRTRGAAVVVLQGGANHDPRVYERPERFDVARFAGDDAPTPLSFGWGAHHCLGAHLARAEGEIVFGALLDRFESIELAGDTPHYRPSFTLRGLDALPVRVT